MIVINANGEVERADSCPENCDDGALNGAACPVCEAGMRQLEKALEAQHRESMRLLTPRPRLEEC